MYRYTAPRAKGRFEPVVFNAGRRTCFNEGFGAVAGGGLDNKWDCHS